MQISWGSIDQKVTWMVWWAFIKLNKKLNGLYVELNLLCFEVRVFLKQLFQSARNWRGWGVEWGALTFYITLGKDCEMLFLSLYAEREVPSASLLCHSPAALESCLAVGNSWAHLLQVIHGSRKRHFSTQELQVTLSWSSSVNCACLGSVLQGFSCALATGTPQLPYSWLPFIMSSSFSCCWTEVFFCCTFSRLCFVLLPGSMGNNCFPFSNEITA